MTCHMQQAIITQIQTASFPETSGLANPHKSMTLLSRMLVQWSSPHSVLLVPLSAILAKSIAVCLGQINQLVVICFLLSMMGLCTQLMAQKLLLVLEARFGKLTSQHYDAILRSDTFHAGINYPIRLALLVISTVPLALSASYKQFVGSTTTIDMDSPVGKYGFTGPPGTQRLGFGLSLMLNVTLPFIAAPAFPQTYGFNLYVESPWYL